AIVALVTGWAIGRFALPLLPTVADPSENTTPTASLKERVASGLRLGLGEVVDTTAPWILVGLALAAAAQALLGSSLPSLLPQGFEVETLALLGMPAYVCASGATPLVAVLIANGVSPGAALAFLLTGPATNVTTVGVLTRLHGRRVAVLFAGAVVLLAIVLGRSVNVFFDLGSSVPALSLSMDHEGGLSDLCLLLVGLLFAGSLLRRGPRGFVGELFDADGDDAVDGHDHVHGNGHDHYHESDSCCEEDCGAEVIGAGDADEHRQ
ncbi:MAG: permease, partial [Candidatus Latescibacterota bacterium]|nr:permease [Candidatus Latescibacterota bacterium]